MIILCRVFGFRLYYIRLGIKAFARVDLSYHLSTLYPIVYFHDDKKLKNVLITSIIAHENIKK